MTATAETVESTTAPLPVVLVGLAEMVELFPHVAKQSVYRWRTRGNLPKPLVTVSGTPLWDSEVIVEWAKGRKLDVDRNALRRVRRAQGHR